MKEGQEVSEFDNICEVQSDKASVTITSRYDGKILKLHHKIDDIALVGKPLLDFDVVEEGDEEDSSSSSSDSSSSSSDSDSDSETKEPEKLTNNKVLTTPSVRRLAKENNVDLTKVPPTGKLGRILKGDMLEYLNLIPKGTQKLHPTLVVKKVAKRELEMPPALTTRTVISPLEGKTVILKGVPKIMFKSMTASLVSRKYTESEF